MSPIQALFDQLREVPLARGAMAILLGLGFVCLARALFRRATPPATWRERGDRLAYWFGVLIGATVLALGVIAVAAELLLLCLGS
jgi:hypothetical protein